MSVAGIIVNYRTPELACKAVDSLLRELDPIPGSHVYLVDNASGDHSVPFLSEAMARVDWQKSVTFLPAPKNGGFGYGINLAVRQALAAAVPPDFFYVLNPDAEVDAGSLGRLLEFAHAHPEAGLIGSHIQSTDGGSQVAAFRFPSFWGEVENAASIGPLTRLLEKHAICLPMPRENCQVDWISGTSMLIRRSTFETVGLFDEEFFLYFEEVDFCRRAWEAGIPAWFVTGAPITHVGAASTGMKDETRRMPGYWFASRHRYFRKHHGPAYAVACDVGRALGMVAWWVKERALGRPGTWRPNLLRDLMFASWKNLRAGGS